MRDLPLILAGGIIACLATQALTAPALEPLPQAPPVLAAPAIKGHGILLAGMAGTTSWTLSGEVFRAYHRAVGPTGMHLGVPEGFRLRPARLIVTSPDAAHEINALQAIITTNVIVLDGMADDRPNAFELSSGTWTQRNFPN